MGLPKASLLLIALLFSAALFVSARELAETPEKKESVEESKYGHGYYRDPDYYDYRHHHHHHHRGWRHHGDHPYYPPTTERKALESYDAKPAYYPGYGYGHEGGYPYGRPGGGYPYGHRGDWYPYHGGYPGGYGGRYPPQGN